MPIFFIVFRETIEAAIIVSVLLGLVEQIVHEDPSRLTSVGIVVPDDDHGSKEGSDSIPAEELPLGAVNAVSGKKLIRKLRIQVCTFIHP